MNRCLYLVSILAAIGLAGCAGEDLGLPQAPIEAAAPWTGKTDVTFFVTGDSHFGGWMGADDRNRLMVSQMNSLAGTPYPEEVGGTVAVPRGVLHLGDLTDSGTLGQWIEFLKVYGLTGGDGLLKYPVFEASGNHDRVMGSRQPVPAEVAKRHGGMPYSWNWDNVHFICLDLYPAASTLPWLRRDLASINRHQAVIIFFHYPLEGEMSDWWSEKEKAAFAQTIEGHNVVCILHGHWHWPEHYRWHGREVFSPGSPAQDGRTFLVVHITDTQLTVTLWDWDGKVKGKKVPQPHWSGETFTMALRPTADAATLAVAGNP